MATATSRISLDLPPLVNPHPLPGHHVRPPDLAPAALSQTRRVSSESQTHGRASPSPRITRRTPVPFLLEAFPAPPSHIPGTPTSVSPGSILGSPSLLGSAPSWLSSVSHGPIANPVSPTSPSVMSPCSPKSVSAALPHSNPPPSSPPSAPLPPVPGPSSVASDMFVHRALQTTARSASPALSMAESHRSQSRTEQRPRLSTDTNDSGRGRGRQGSLSSLRNPIYPLSERNGTIVEEPVEEPSSSSPLPLNAPQFGSVAERKSQDQSRGDSPEITRSRVAVTPLLRPDDKSCVEDSIANVDISDLKALKSDNEGDGEEQASHPFPRFPPLSRSQPQSPSDHPPIIPLYAHTPRKPSESSVSEAMSSGHGATSPEITHMISTTPRPRKRSASSRSRESSSTRDQTDNSRSRRGTAVPPVPTSSHATKTTVKKTARLSGDTISVSGEDEASGSDSSLDLHTPLPELMLRHGMLSPNSKLLPQLEQDSTRLSILSSSSHLSNASNLSLKSMASTSSKHPKDTRDTPQRRVRHRDGKLLKGGIGLTTGLGWSDSEDEDAPSALTRRVSTLVLSRRASSSSVASYRSARSQSNSTPLARSISHSILREADEYEIDADEFGHSDRFSMATRSLPSRSKPVSRVGSVRSTGSSLGRYSTYSISSAGMRPRNSSISESSVYSTSIISKSDATPVVGHTSSGLMPGIREQDDGVTPTRAAFERSSLGSLNGSTGVDVPHTPSSTASSASLPFPATPESGEEISQAHPVYNQDKVLPPLPPGVRGKYPSTLSLRSQFKGLQRPRVSSSASSTSNNSIPGVLPGNVKSSIASTTSTPRQSLAERQVKTPVPTAGPRPSLNGTPRPSLTIPKSPFPAQSATSGLPRPTTPSSLSSVTTGQGYAPRPLRLAELNQSPSKVLQPGEQPPRPGQILTYNRNVHDQLKMRTLSLNTGPNRAQGPTVSPGSTQTVLITSAVVASGSNSPLSTPVTPRSQSPLPSPSVEGFRPKPRTGTGMMYRNNLSVGSAAASRIRVPSTVTR